MAVLASVLVAILVGTRLGSHHPPRDAGERAAVLCESIGAKAVSHVEITGPDDQQRDQVICEDASRHRTVITLQ